MTVGLSELTVVTVVTVDAMSTCSCGAGLPSEARFCSSCGEPVTAGGKRQCKEEDIEAILERLAKRSEINATKAVNDAVKRMEIWEEKLQQMITDQDRRTTALVTESEKRLQAQIDNLRLLRSTPASSIAGPSHHGEATNPSYLPNWRSRALLRSRSEIRKRSLKRKPSNTLRN